ncbi:MAG: SIMPL domain-containing protein [Deltaproteobacteria bacterium]|nr:SIMPL domain-containing protein [Deltaproteobacteria bacterium]
MKIEVLGTGVVHRKPDVSVLKVSCHVVADKAAAARATHAAASERIAAVLRDARVGPQDLRGSGFSLGEHYKQTNQGQQRAGFYVQSELSFAVRELADVALLFDLLTAAGATRIEGPNLEVSDEDTHRMTARSLAYADALKKAEAYCAAAGLRVLGPLDIIEQPSHYNSGPPGKFLGEDGAVVVSSKAITVAARVTFEVERLEV